MNPPPSPSTTVPNEHQQTVSSRVSPVLIRLAYGLFRYLVLPVYFRQIEVKGREHLPAEGAVILAPTHRSRWDALMVAYAAGRHVTGRDLRFMVTIDEMKGIQGWFIRRLGGFPVNTRKSDIGSLRHGIDLLKQKRMLVIFPEGRIVEAEADVQTVQAGLAYLGLQAEKNQPGLEAEIVPISIRYRPPVPSWRSEAEIEIGAPIAIADYCHKPIKDCAQEIRDDLKESLQALHQPQVASLSQG